MRVDATSYDDATGRLLEWAGRGESRYLCAACVNSVMEAHDSAELMEVMNQADLVTPDGMPLVWALRLLGIPGATRVYGPDLTRTMLAACAREGVPVGFYGGHPEALERLLGFARSTYPGLRIAYSWSPPFRALDPEEDEQAVAAINESGARILFVGLSTPKQDRWMARHRGRVRAVMLGVGAAFDFLGGSKPQAPRWMMGVGLEWLFRMATEPRRLWRRYTRHNPRFVYLFALQLIGFRRAG